MEILHSFQYDDTEYRIVRYGKKDYNIKFGEYAVEREVRPGAFAIWRGELGFKPLLSAVVDLLQS